MVTVPIFAKAAFRVTCQPALFVAKRERRYRAAGHVTSRELPVMGVAPMPERASCTGDCADTERLSRRHLAEYRTLGRSWRLRPWLGTACAIPLGEHGGYEAYEAAVRQRTGDALRRSVRKARRQGYVTGLFHPPHVRGQMAAILGSKRFRSGGLVPYGLLGGASLPPDIGHQPGFDPDVPCPLHWTLYWGVFAADRQLVGFVKLRRMGTLVHALQIMGHGDHMGAGIVDLMHMDLVRWLCDDPAGRSAGVTHYMYGALEHAGDGLAAWKLRRGFRPVLVDVRSSA